MPPRSFIDIDPPWADEGMIKRPASGQTSHNSTHKALCRGEKVDIRVAGVSPKEEFQKYESSWLPIGHPLSREPSNGSSANKLNLSERFEDYLRKEKHLHDQYSEEMKRHGWQKALLDRVSAAGRSKCPEKSPSLSASASVSNVSGYLEAAGNNSKKGSRFDETLRDGCAQDVEIERITPSTVPASKSTSRSSRLSLTGAFFNIFFDVNKAVAALREKHASDRAPHDSANDATSLDMRRRVGNGYFRFGTRRHPITPLSSSEINNVASLPSSRSDLRKTSTAASTLTLKLKGLVKPKLKKFLKLPQTDETRHLASSSDDSLDYQSHNESQLFHDEHDLDGFTEMTTSRSEYTGRPDSRADLMERRSESVEAFVTSQDKTGFPRGSSSLSTTSRGSISSSMIVAAHSDGGYSSDKPTYEELGPWQSYDEEGAVSQQGTWTDSTRSETGSRLFFIDQPARNAPYYCSDTVALTHSENPVQSEQGCTEGLYTMHLGSSPWEDSPSEGITSETGISRHWRRPLHVGQSDYREGNGNEAQYHSTRQPPSDVREAHFNSVHLAE